MSSRVSKQCGFTMLEIVAVVAVSSVLAVMGLPLIKDFQQNFAAAGVQQQFADTLANARERAVAVGQSVFICASGDGISCSSDTWEKGWLVYQSAQRKKTGENVPSEEIIEHVTNSDNAYTLTVLDESAASVSEIRFDARGFNGAQQRVVAVLCNAGDNAESDAILVERTGRVRIGKNTLSGDAATGQFSCNQA